MDTIKGISINPVITFNKPLLCGIFEAVGVIFLHWILLELCYFLLYLNGHITYYLLCIHLIVIIVILGSAGSE